jgi:hypothetical protein
MALAQDRDKVMIASVRMAGSNEIEIAGYVGRRGGASNRPVLILKVTESGEPSVVTQCTCPQVALCPHALALLMHLNEPMGQAEAERLVRTDGNLDQPLPAPKTEGDSIEWPNDQPQPALNLRRMVLPGKGRQSWGIAEPVVHYPGCPERLPMLSRKAPAPWTDAEGRSVRLTRHLALERLFLADLVQAQLRPVSEIKPDAAGNEEQWRLLMTVPESSQALFWATFLRDTVPYLRASGWRVDISGDFGFGVVEAREEAWYTDLHAATELDAFDLDFGLDLDGERLSLVPIIVECVDQGLTTQVLEASPGQNFLIAIGTEDRVLSIPGHRLLGLMRFLDDLLASRPNKNRASLRLDRLRAAQLESLDGLPIQAPVELAALRQRLANVTQISAVAPPTGLRAQLRPYQLEGLSWLQFLRECGLHGVLADDMGLGKTLQTLAHLLLEKESGRMDRPSLILAPTSVIRNWGREAARFCPALRVLLLHGDDRRGDFFRIPRHDLVITSYPLLVRDADQLCGQEWHIVALDEAQNIKNPKSRAAQVAGTLRARHRLCLTGTPMENHLGELWSLFHFLMPGLLGDAESFRAFYRNPIEREQDQERQAQLASRLRPVLLRRTKSAVAKDLPPKTEILHTIELEKPQTDLYETIRAAADKRVREAICAQGLDRSQIVVLDALLKLRQVCCHPKLVKADSARAVEESAKTAYLMEELLPELIDEGHKVLIFSQFTEMLALIEEQLRQRRLPFVKLTGDTRDRETPMCRFQAGEIPIFLISLKAGGAGLNLTAADTVIHYDPWWNPAAEAQASDRAHRIGQTKPVFIHKLICQGTIEERILELQRSKAALVEGLLTGSTDKLRLTQDDIQRLLQA